MGLTIGNVCVCSIPASGEKFADYRYAAYRAASDLGFHVVRNPEDVGTAPEKFEGCLKKNYPVFVLLVCAPSLPNMIKKECKLALDLGLEIIPLLKTKNETISAEEEKLRASISKATFQRDCSCFNSCEKLYNILKAQLIQYRKDSQDATAVLIPQYAQVYVKATDFVSHAKKRLIICQKTSTLILGPRTSVTVEDSFYQKTISWISSSSKNMDFLHIFSLDETIRALGSSEYDLQKAKVRLFNVLARNQSKNVIFRGVNGRFVPCVIGDNEMLISTAVGTSEYNLVLPKYIMDASALLKFITDLQVCGELYSSSKISALYSSGGKL